ncbi:MAG: hypothetical protein IJM50_04560 [Lachnospiraceae bacterium]|nr:hypothetical protein [Lachnospiraceae bacterium]
MLRWEHGAGFIAGLLLTGCVYLFLTSKKQEKSLKGGLRWLRNFLTFRKIYLEAVLRFLYILTTCFVVATGFLMIFERGWRGLLLMIVGPVAVRIVYELLMLFIVLVKNVMEINNSIQGRTESPVVMADPDAFNNALQKKADELGEAFEKKESDAGEEECAALRADEPGVFNENGTAIKGKSGEDTGKQDA